MNDAGQQFRQALQSLLEQFDLHGRIGSFDAAVLLGPERTAEFHELFYAEYVAGCERFFEETFRASKDWREAARFARKEGPDRWDRIAYRLACGWKMQAIDEVPPPYFLQNLLGLEGPNQIYFDKPFCRSWKRLRDLCRERDSSAYEPEGASRPSETQPIDSRARLAAPTVTGVAQTVAACTDIQAAAVTAAGAGRHSMNTEERSAREDRKARRHQLVDPVWDGRKYQNCEDWADEKSPKQNQKAPSARALDNWLSGRTIKPTYRVQAWIAGSLKVDLKTLS